MSLKEVLINLRSIGLSSPESEIPYITDEPKIPNFVTLPSESSIKKYSFEGNHGQGYHRNETLSRIKSIAECLERLCLDNPIQSRLFKESFSDGNLFADPGIFPCYSEVQIGDRDRFAKEAREGEYLWIEAEDLINKKKIKIPAQSVFLADLFSNEFQLRRERISTGAALGLCETNRAFNSGLLEAIERDSCIYAYLTKKNIPRIVNLNGEAGELEKYLRRYNFELFVFDATSDLGVPTSISIVIDRTGLGPAVDVGSSSSFAGVDVLPWLPQAA